MRAFRTPPAYLTARSRRLRQEATDAEALLWSDLRDGRLNGYKFVRQRTIKPYIVDFACRSRRLVVEIDGSQHADNARDTRRTAYLNHAGWSVVRFWNDEIFKERRAVLETILAVLDGRITETSDGAGLLDVLRFSPSKPSPASLRSAPSPGSGEGEAPPSAPSSPHP